MNGAVLDSGCTQTVCGRSWLSNYIDSLTDDDRLKVKEKKSNTVFKFGDGKLFNSLKLATIPAKIGSKYVDINTDVINSELQSKNAMKLAKVKIDFGNDIINIFGEDIDISFTASGHYFIPISRTNKTISEIDESNPAERIVLNIANIASKSKEEKLKIVKKLHCQFGHASAQKLQKLVKSSSVKDVELLHLFDEIEKKCEICIKYKKPSLKPAVGFSLSKEFNDVISVDLKHISGTMFLHIIDNATRFSAAAVVKSKRQEEIVDIFIKHWIAIFGAPEMIISDNGGEFNNTLFTNMAELFNINVKPTAAESPWSNGMVERHNAILAKTIEKLSLEHKNNYPIDVIIAWAVNAKNSLHNCYGYSPNQLVFGHNPSLPSILTNALPAMEDSTNELLKRHLNAIAESRKAFIECEANEKLRRAIKSKLWPTTSLIYELGDEVYYKRNYSNQWKGPGTVIGKENKQVIVKHGGQHIRVHPCRLQLRNKYQSIDPILDDSNGNNLCKESTQKNVNRFYDDNVNENEDIAIKNTRIENISELNSSMSNDDLIN